MIRSFAKFLIEVDSENVFISQISTKLVKSDSSTLSCGVGGGGGGSDDAVATSNNHLLSPSNSIDNSVDEASSAELQQQQMLNQCHDILYQLINSLFEICISIPVELVNCFFLFL